MPLFGFGYGGTPYIPPSQQGGIQRPNAMFQEPSRLAALGEMLGSFGGRLMAAGAPSFDPGHFGKTMGGAPNEISQIGRGFQDRMNQFAQQRLVLEKMEEDRKERKRVADLQERKFGLQEDLYDIRKGEADASAAAREAELEDKARREQAFRSFQINKKHGTPDNHPRQQELFSIFAPDKAQTQQAKSVYGGEEKGDRERTFEAKAKSMIDFGVPPEVAYGVASGRYQAHRDPTNGRLDVIDMTTGGMVFNGSAQQADAAIESTPLEAPIKPTVPTDINYAEATGSSGVFGLGANTFADFFGFDLPAPEAEDAAQALNSMKNRTLAFLQSAYPGNRPSVFLMQKIEPLLLEPGALTQGDQRSRMRVTQTRNTLRGIRDELQRDYLDSPDNWPPQILAEARRKLHDVDGLLRDYDVIVDSFERNAGAGGGQAPMTATNPETGERVRYNERTKQWEPM